MTEREKSLSNANIAEALGAEYSAPVGEALGVGKENMKTPLGMIALANGFNERVHRMRVPNEEE